MIIAALIAAATTANAMSYLTLGDSVRVNPNRLDGYAHMSVTAYFEGYADNWTFAATYPQGLFPKLVSGVTPLDGLTVPYVDRNGNDQIYECPLNCTAAYANIGSNIMVDGYWDYNMDGVFESYGTVKWTPGYHQMFEFNMFLEPTFRSGYITLDGRITSGTDRRGPILADVMFFSRTFVWVGYMKGDLNGDEIVDVSDVTILISLVLGNFEPNEWQLPAGDINEDNKHDVGDVTALIAYIMTK